MRVRYDSIDDSKTMTPNVLVKLERDIISFLQGNKHYNIYKASMRYEERNLENLHISYSTFITESIRAAWIRFLRLIQVG